ncbi:hypothetical protein [Streptomyces sp. NRRL S-237]|uniref:hypothetical protein n=1 Tax=Streptomyces sp. NRRL S-237 TaxID=1463895 RepID=UPI0007C52E1D|nr:hypothetical protein [Streptomyces sp. NRRL S-237]
MGHDRLSDTVLVDGIIPSRSLVPRIGSLHGHLAPEPDARLARGMHHPVRRDPPFEDFMTLADIHRYPTRHFDFHRRQLAVSDGG